MRSLFRNTEELLEEGGSEGPRKDILSVFAEAIKGADAYAAVRRAVHRDGDRIRIGNRFTTLERLREIAFVAAGKAAGPMAAALVDSLGDAVTQGLLISPEDPPKEVHFQKRIVREPLFPTAEGARASGEAVELLMGLSKGDLLVPLLSPGALGMLCLPPGDMGWERYREILMSAIHHGEGPEGILAVARSLSETQGGRLSEAAPEVAIEALVVERGEGGEAIGAGPVSSRPPGDPEKARHVLREIGWWDRLEPKLRDKAMDERPFPRSLWESPHVVTVAGPGDALDAAGAESARLKHKPKLVALHDHSSPESSAEKLVSAVEGSARERLPKGFLGLSGFSSLTLGTVEGGERPEILHRFLERAKLRLKRRDTIVAILYTGGSMGEAGEECLGMVEGRGEAVLIPMKSGFTDVGSLAVGWMVQQG